MTWRKPFPTRNRRYHFTVIRWAEGAYCPHCGSTKVYHFRDNRSHKYGDCKKRFSIKVGTVFGDTKIGLRKWFMVIWLIPSHTKGIASTQLAKVIKVTQKTAWFMLHRLRHAARAPSFNRPLSGTVEDDETFIGRKEKNKHASKRKHRGRRSVGKASVVGLKERNGELRTMHVDNPKAMTVESVVRHNVALGTNLMTDEHPSYRGLAAEYFHETVNHSAGEYVRQPEIHTNGIESIWALLKRQIIGVHHWVTAKHLQRYLDEMMFRQNRRDGEEWQRVNMLLGWAAEKRLT